ncbi:uncharacterized protein LOC130669136 [Microplitis mediator]|uniref:uncharacterized protein LOC130669136 n=1 Tax=Microplitis mediator TaxID=375433 RepID=UPI002552A596|nr:uncharacterized protein LOC130669136 [Microplitis mediator]
MVVLGGLSRLLLNNKLLQTCLVGLSSIFFFSGSKKSDGFTSISQYIKMSWSSRPVMISLSLTGVLVGLYYYSCEEDDSKDSLRQVITIKVGIPSDVALELACFGGIEHIEKFTSTRIILSNDNINGQRICSITGKSQCVEHAKSLFFIIAEEVRLNSRKNNLKNSQLSRQVE